MSRLAVVVLAVLGLAHAAGAAPHKILVLPTEGTADAAIRTKLTAQIVKHAKTLDGQVATAEATFADTALAVGCDPQAQGCSDQVLATLGVDELVWATATKDGAQTKLVVRRATRGTPTREASTMISAADPADHIDAGMTPLFGPPATGVEPVVPGPTAPPNPTKPPPTDVVAPNPIPPPATPEDLHDRNVGIAFAAGGGVALVLGVALWASYASLQDSIDSHAIVSRGDFDDLKSLEDRASTYAIAGDCLVIAGLAAGGLGAYYLYRNHNQHRIAITPAPIASGAGLTLTILGGL
jgi:hypothetical protein